MYRGYSTISLDLLSSHKGQGCCAHRLGTPLVHRHRISRANLCSRNCLQSRQCKKLLTKTHLCTHRLDTYRLVCCRSLERKRGKPSVERKQGQSLVERKRGKSSVKELGLPWGRVVESLRPGIRIYRIRPGSSICNKMTVQGRIDRTRLTRLSPQRRCECIQLPDTFACHRDWW